MRIFFVTLSLGMICFLNSGCESGSALVVKGASSSSDTNMSRMRATRILNDEGPAIGSPSSVTMKLFALYVSASEDCSSPTLVQDYGSAGVEKDFFEAGVTLFEGDPAAGEYKCVIIKVSDNIKFKADSQAVNASGSPCVTDTEYTIDIYRTDSGDSWKDVAGAAITARGADGSPVADDVFLFVSRTPASISSSTAHENQTGTLSSNLVVPGQARFYADATGQVVDNGDECGLNGLTFGFQ